MRESRFRVWKKSVKKYLDFETLTMNSNGKLRAIASFSSLEPVLGEDDYILEQYTGLKDRNGGEIYEGDIVNIQGVKYYVDFEHGGFWFNNDNRRWKSNRPFTHFQEINDTEVIGNIHENGDLLKEEEC